MKEQVETAVRQLAIDTLMKTTTRKDKIATSKSQKGLRVPMLAV